MFEVLSYYPVDMLISSDPAEARRVQEEIERALRTHHFCDHDIFSIRLALEEALVNAMKHGNQMDRNKKIRVAYRVDDQRIDLLIADEGVGFNPEELPDPTAVENLERPSGRGVMLMRHYMTAVAYSDRGNAVSMCKVRNGTK